MKNRISIFAIFCGLLAVMTVAAAEFATFTYDTAGRLIAINHGSGKGRTYQYDVTGNLKRATDVVTADGDGDGMANAWELLYFKTTARDGTGDFDEDGFSDLAEFLAGTNPDDSESLLRMERSVTKTVLQTTVRWNSVSGKTYRVQFKAGLSDIGWNDLPGLVVAAGTNSTKVDITTPGAIQRFYRVEVLP
ncbi:MAG TPA: RHS repeat domain-containing protein [Verrucomicrobiae bacterium]|nr:RHS repeat domain-containing protein [Verrucomicrobiae bacterium]